MAVAASTWLGLDQAEEWPHGPLGDALPLQMAPAAEAADTVQRHLAVDKGQGLC